MKNLIQKIRLVLCMVLITASQLLTAQTLNYADSETYSSGVSNSGDAIDENLGSASTMSIGIGLGASINQTLIFDDPIDAHTTLRVKIGQGSGLLAVGVSVNIEVFNNASLIDSYTLSSLLDLINGSGTETIEITPTSTYDRVRITLSVGLGLAVSLNVYEAYYITGSGGSCDLPYDVVSGTHGSLLGGLSGVSNPGNCIDENENSYSELSSTVGVASGNYVKALFASSSNSSVHILIGDADDLLTIGVLNGIAFNVYNGGSKVGEYSSGNLIFLSLLSGGGDKGWVSFEPGVAFDRIEVIAGALVGALSDLRVYEIQRGPTVTQDSDSLICYYNESITIDGSDYDSPTPEWYDEDQDYINEAVTYVTGALTTDTKYYAIFKNACEKVEHIETLNVEIVTLSPEALNTGETTVPYSEDLSLRLAGAPESRSYRYQLADGSSLPPGLTLAEDGSISGTPTAIGLYTFDVVITDITDPSNEIPAGTHEYSTVVSQTLPVVINEFLLSENSDSPIISWNLENQATIAQQFLQRSVDGIHWTTIYTETISESTGGQYEYRDIAVAKTQQFYRLMITETNNTTIYSHVLKMKLSHEKLTTVSSYPNPSKGDLSMVNTLSEMIQADIYDASGRAIKTNIQIPANTTHQLDVSFLQSGLFYILYRNPSGENIHTEIKIKQ